MCDTTTTRRLRRGQVLSVRIDREPLRARVLFGAVWATVEGDARDHALAAPGAVTLEGSGLAVIEALEDGTVVEIDESIDLPGPATTPTPPSRPARRAA